MESIPPHVPHPHHPRFDSLYGYEPTEWICIVFVVLYSVFGLGHFIQASYYRTWWMFPTAVLAACGEVIGWSGRLWSSQNGGVLLTPFLMQISTTIISPTPLVAANFVILGRLIKLVGVEYSRLGPNMYMIIFCAADVVALVVQAIGGAKASTALQTGGNIETGSHIMLGGIAFQLVVIVFYSILAMEFITRVVFKKPVHRREPEANNTTPSVEEHKDDLVQDAGAQKLRRKIKLLVLGLGFSTLCLFIRSVYRTAELSNGFNGRINNTQRYFNWLDGAMIVLALATWNFLHPGRLFPREK